MTLTLQDISDITIVGAGPVGMFAAFYAGMRNAKVKIIDALPVLGGQVSLLYPEKKIYDIGGFPGITGKEFIHGLKKQMEHFNHSIFLEETVLNIQKQENGIFKIGTSKGSHFTRTILIATGNGVFKPRKLPIESASKFENKNLHYMVSNKKQYENMTVAICGGGDSAVDWALELEKKAKKVYLIHRRPTFRAHEYPVSLLKQSTVEVLTPYVPSSLQGSQNTLESVTFKEVRGEKEITLPVDYFIVNYGFSSSGDFLNKWGLKTNRNSIVVNSKMETNIPGIYAAGDIVTYEGKIKLIATGFGDAPTAVNHAIHYLDPSKRTQPIQSTQLHFASENN